MRDRCVAVVVPRAWARDASAAAAVRCACIKVLGSLRVEGALCAADSWLLGEDDAEVGAFEVVEGLFPMVRMGVDGGRVMPNSRRSAMNHAWTR